MAFFSAVIQTLLKAAVIAVVAFGGINLGKKLRDNKDAKTAASEAADAEATAEGTEGRRDNQVNRNSRGPYNQRTGR